MQASISKAASEAAKSTMTSRHGAVLCTSSGKYVASGRNNMRTRVNGEAVPSCHAERAVLIQARKLCRQKRGFESRFGHRRCAFGRGRQNGVFATM